MTDYLTPTQFNASDGVGDWRVIVDGANAFFKATSFAASAAFVQAIAVLPRMGEIGTGVDVRHDGVTVKLLTQADDWWGPSARDVDLARAISVIARERRGSQRLNAGPSRSSPHERVRRVFDARARNLRGILAGRSRSAGSRPIRRRGASPRPIRSPHENRAPGECPFRACSPCSRVWSGTNQVDGISRSPRSERILGAPTRTPNSACDSFTPGESPPLDAVGDRVVVERQGDRPARQIRCAGIVATRAADLP